MSSGSDREQELVPTETDVDDWPYCKQQRKATVVSLDISDSTEGWTKSFGVQQADRSMTKSESLRTDVSSVVQSSSIPVAQAETRRNRKFVTIADSESVDDECNRLTRDGAAWQVDMGKGSPMRWREPPSMLDRLIGGLFSAKPDDVLSWVHQAVWKLHAEELRMQYFNDDHLVPLEHSPVEDIGSKTQPLYRAGPSAYADAVDGTKSVLPLWHDQISVKLRPEESTFVGEEASIATKTKAPSSYLSSASLGQEQQKPIDFDEMEKKIEHMEKQKHDVSIIANIPIKRGARHEDTLHEKSATKSSSTASTVESLEDTNSNFVRYFGKANNQIGRFHSQPSVNKVGMNAEASLTEAAVEYEEEPSKCVMHPVGRVRNTWDFVYFNCLLFDMWTTPMELVFFPEETGGPAWFRIANKVLLAFFCCDIVMNFFTGYVHEGAIILKKRRIAATYLKFWFWFDALATIPEIVFANMGQVTFLVRISRGMKTYKIVRALRLLRASRLYRTQSIVHMIMMRIPISPAIALVFKILQIHAVLVLMVHAHGSIWAVMQPSGWRALEDDEAWGNYFESLWSVVPSLTLGGDLPASNVPQHMLAIIISFERVSYIIFLLTWLLWRASLQQADAERTCNVESALNYLKFHGVSPAVQFKVFQNLHEVGDVQRRQQQYTKLAERNFPSQLKRMISDEIWSEKLMSIDLVHFLARWNSEIVQALASLVTEEVFASQVLIFSVGEMSRTAYFIVRGQIAVTYHETENFVPDFLTGMWIGETALINPELRRIQTLVCKVWSQLMALAASDFHSVIDQFELKDSFHQLLRSQLWLGLCGRCGILGDHFSHDCPTIDDKYGTRRSKAGKVKRKQRRMVGDDTSGDLRRFLDENHLSRLQTAIAAYGVKNLNDLKLSTIEALKADPELQLSQSELQFLSDASIKAFRKKMNRACCRVLVNSGSENNHFVFISHYKLEAGTEAALMQEDLQKVILEDSAFPGLRSPVFLDSEDLRDLNEVKQHVSRSHNLLLLLTPGVLSRPWCIVEIVSAVKFGVRIVPVEVQRKGLAFPYPDENFFRKVRAGKMLDERARKFLHRQGIDDETLESSLRQIFMRIALPFSPHKTHAIRKAELRDILKQCMLREALCDDDFTNRGTGRHGVGDNPALQISLSKMPTLHE